LIDPSPASASAMRLSSARSDSSLWPSAKAAIRLRMALFLLVHLISGEVVRLGAAMSIHKFPFKVQASFMARPRDQQSRQMNDDFEAAIRAASA
jgi:hypothetical protein